MLARRGHPTEAKRPAARIVELDHARWVYGVRLMKLAHPNR